MLVVEARPPPTQKLLKQQKRRKRTRQQVRARLAGEGGAAHTPSAAAGQAPRTGAGARVEETEAGAPAGWPGRRAVGGHGAWRRTSR